MLSEPPCRFGNNKTASFLVLIVKVLKMKIYTLTWRNNPSFGFRERNKSGIYRFLFRPYTRYYFEPNESPLHNFLMLAAFSDNYRSHYMRLSSCGRLVSRFATYQGV